MTDGRHDATIIEALARLRDGIDVPPIDPAREQALLAAFDAHWARPRPAMSRWGWAAAAALVAVTVTLNWLVIATMRPARHSAWRDGGPIDVGVPDSAADLAGFVPWPGADAWPPFESGSLVRVELPV